MGWTCTHYPKNMKFKDFVKKEFEYENERVKLTVIDASLVFWTEGYIAVEVFNKEKNTKEVFALVLMVTWHRDDYHNICYKDMDEMEMPYLKRCPKKILKLLTPTDNEFALDWRKMCNDYHAQKDKVNEMFRKVRVGDKLVFKRELHFADGYKAKEMTVTYKSRKKLYANNYYVINKKTLIDYLDNVIEASRT